ncbi:MAG: hypothetical protein A2148_06460 [Chloroflexi bacterium RBG_16_68_14]|nr:MAG: hypothetical protein A2148_06460 [Chloroflexi bacterium RBG_16_68_14]
MTVEAGASEPQATLRHYALQSPAVLGRNEVGFMNDNWLVADGASGERYLLRAYRRVRDARRIAFQLAFQAHLLAGGFPTSTVVKTRSGEPFASTGGLHWALFGFVEGEEFDFTRLEQSREAGKRLAQFEAIAAGYAGPVVEPPVVEVATWLAPVSSHVWRASVLTDQHEERLRELHAGPDYAGDLAFFSAWRREAAQAWPVERLAALPDAWLHCDYHGRNMVFQGDDLAGLFDFDFVGRGPRVFDVARGVFNFGREYRGSTMLREESCHAFLEGFESLEPLSHEERHALPFMAVLNWAPDAAFDAARQQEPGDPGAGSRLQFAVRMMHAIQAELRRLAPQFGWGDA